MFLRNPVAAALLVVLLAAVGTAAAQSAKRSDLLAIYQDAVANDATFASARFARMAAAEREPQARAATRWLGALFRCAYARGGARASLFARDRAAPRAPRAPPPPPPPRSYHDAFSFAPARSPPAERPPPPASARPLRHGHLRH